MALSPLGMLVVVIVSILFPFINIVVAKEFVVGDDHGWTTGFNYAAWAADKTFHVGDVLVFEYVVGKDNVFKVNGTAFQSCTIPPGSEVVSTGSGNDRIVLANPGKKWYISGIFGNCNAGQKLAITVQPQTLPPTLPPSPTPAPSPRQHRPHFGRWVPNIFH